jgi:magnesium-transporting ATPase (P-type)
VATASVLRFPLPLLPLQILYLNVVTDVFPAMALGEGEGDPQVMERPPRDPNESVLTRRQWLEIGGWTWFSTSGCGQPSVSASGFYLQQYISPGSRTCSEPKRSVSQAGSLSSRLACHR